MNLWYTGCNNVRWMMTGSVVGTCIISITSYINNKQQLVYLGPSRAGYLRIITFFWWWTWLTFRKFVNTFSQCINPRYRLYTSTMFCNSCQRQYHCLMILQPFICIELWSSFINARIGKENCLSSPTWKGFLWEYFMRLLVSFRDLGMVMLW